MSYIVNILPPHLVPLPMGEETLAKLSLIYKNNCDCLANLASPMGRGARQRGEGVGFLSGKEIITAHRRSICLN